MSKVINHRNEKSTDLYGTPKEAVDMLLPYIPKKGKIWECCNGYGAISGRLKEKGFRVIVSDKEKDALTYQPKNWDILITNPPYSLKTEFLGRCRDLGKPFALLMPSDLVGVKKVEILDDVDLQLIIPDRRIRFHRFDNGKITEAPSPNLGAIWYCGRMNLPKDMIFVKNFKQERI